ncbi:MAG: hypothetical protein IH823_09115, partial [Candidatus Dadabacteria bacterium]|nr:hypothetical protein [Candidatus Dadabacteria bacterium]
MWKATFIFIARFGGGGLVGYAAPRFLIASGVPLDTWIKYLAYKFKDASAWINYDSIYWVLVLIIGLFVISLTYLIPYFLSKQKQEKVAEIIESPPKKKETSETDDLRGIWLSEAVLYAGGLGWNPQLAEQVPTTSEINAAYKGLEMIIQAALDGDLIIYGRDGFAGPLKPIPSEYWGKFGVNALHVLS